MSLIEPGTSRNVSKTLPLSVGLWFDNEELNEFKLAASDIITFHNYRPTDSLENQIAELKIHNRHRSSARNGWRVPAVAWSARTCPFLQGTKSDVSIEGWSQGKQIPFTSGSNSMPWSRLP